MLAAFGWSRPSIVPRMDPVTMFSRPACHSLLPCGDSSLLCDGGREICRGALAPGDVWWDFEVWGWIDGENVFAVAGSDCFVGVMSGRGM